MKKIIVMFLLALMCSVNIFAQEKGHWTANVSGVYAGNLSWSKTGEDLGTAFGEIIATIITLGLYTPDNGGYAYTDPHDYPGFVAQGGYQILPWLQITGDLYYHHYAYERYKNKEDLVPGQTNKINRLAFLPGAKFTYLNKGIFHMYSSLSCGVGVNFGKRVTGEEVTPLNKVNFTAQVVPIGIALGRKHYGFFDLGIGSEYDFFRLGYGYNF